jgi:hypothetical protein
MSLDEAMDLELGKLGEDIDPLNTTAISSAEEVSVTTTRAQPESADDEKTPSDSLPAETRSAPGMKRGVGVGIGIGVLLTIVAGIYFATANPTEGEIVIESTPPNAEIEIDGATLPGARTPFTATLPIGDHDIRLRAEGYEPRVFKVEISKDQTARLAKDDAVLTSLGPPEPKKFNVEAKPDDASLSADGVEFGTGHGVLTVKPEQEIIVEATRAGCTPRKVHLKHTFASETLQITLVCADEDAGTAEPPKEQKNGTSGLKRITIRTTPPGASIELNGKTIGVAPITQSFKPTDILKVRATKEGFAPIAVERKAGTIKNSLHLKLQAAQMGCLNLRLGFPAVARVAIDGTFLPGEVGRLTNHPLAAGVHDVRAKNDTVGKDETFKVDIKPGSDCTLKVIWPRT